METQEKEIAVTPAPIKPDAEDFLPLNGTDHLEFYVGNAKQAAYYYQTAFGFQPLAYAGLETGLRDKSSYVLRQGKATFVFTTPLVAYSPIADHIKLHGDGVKVIALWVDDAEQSYRETISRGAKSFGKGNFKALFESIELEQAKRGNL